MQRKEQRNASRAAETLGTKSNERNPKETILREETPEERCRLGLLADQLEKTLDYPTTLRWNVTTTTSLHRNARVASSNDLETIVADDITGYVNRLLSPERLRGSRGHLEPPAGYRHPRQGSLYKNMSLANDMCHVVWTFR